MKNVKRIIFLSFVILFFSCKKGKELKTDSGFRYILYTESKGEKAKVGDYLTISMIYSNNNDSVLFDSRKNGKPIRFRLEKIPFKGSFEDGLTNLSKGDSATFFVPADSLYNYLYKSRGKNDISQSASGFNAGTYVTFDLKLENIQNETEAEEEMVLQLSAAEKREKEDFKAYILKNKINTPADSSGYYLIINENGSGETIDSGKIVTINYEARFLNDSIFISTKSSGQPYKFISGAHHVIPGWEIAMKKLHAGDKFTLIVPSKLAYGEEGIRDPQTGLFIVPPYSPLAFDIEIISVEEVPAATSKN